MIKLSLKNIRRLLVIFLAIEMLSFIGWAWPAVGIGLFIILALATLGASLYRLEYGLGIVLGELLIGSLGHLFYWPLVGGQIPIRIALWSILMAVYLGQFVWQLFRQGRQSQYYQSGKNFVGRFWFSLLLFFVIVGLVNGLVHGHDFQIIFSDLNAWLYFALLGPAVAVYQRAAADKLSRLAEIFLAGALWLSLKTLFLLFIFTHAFSAAPEIYLWLRQTLVGEMTPTGSGWPRIFIQGQIYCALAWFLVFWFSQATFQVKEFFQRHNFLTLISSGLFLSSILVSFSRSFWVALAATLAVSLLLLWRFWSFKKMLAATGWVIISGIFSVLIIYLVVAFPYIHPAATDFSANFLARVTSGNEAALASRWSLFPILWQAIEREPLLGQGYGATVTYFSSDPRILQNSPSGQYTTYAFEWGYLDLWLKIGLLGLAAYLILLLKLIGDSWSRGGASRDYLLLGLGSGLLFLLVTHAFTPYLNHPLGIGYLVVASCLIWRDRVY